MYGRASKKLQSVTIDVTGIHAEYGVGAREHQRAARDRECFGRTFKHPPYAHTHTTRSRSAARTTVCSRSQQTCLSAMLISTWTARSLNRRGANRSVIPLTTRRPHDARRRVASRTTTFSMAATSSTQRINTQRTLRQCAAIPGSCALGAHHALGARHDAASTLCARTPVPALGAAVSRTARARRVA